MKLDEALKEYSGQGIYPFHMPGHKRRWNFPADPYGMDITEIDGFDNLHHAEGILREAQERAAELYQAQRAWYLINGSTCGILAAISAAVPRGSKVLTARNCHKAVYHALALRQLHPVYLYPEVTSQGLQGRLDPDKVRKTIAANPDAKALIVTSPTYDGILSDIQELAQLAHGAGMVLIVDQAHGAHFGLSGQMPPSAGQLGADLVIVSVHKTLPAFTQTALLLCFSGRVPQDSIDHWLDVYETSSPSYLLMAGIDRCLDFCASPEGKTAFEDWRRKLDLFYSMTEELKLLKVLRKKDFTAEEAWKFDDSKILILTEGSGLTGGRLADLLRTDYRIEPEMTALQYVLALTSAADTEEGYRRLAEALQDLDRRLQESRTAEARQKPGYAAADLYRPMNRAMEIYEAEEAPAEVVPEKETAGRISSEYLYLYPPGIPLVVPGERIGADTVRQLAAAAETGIEVCGRRPGGLAVVKEASLYYNEQI